MWTSPKVSVILTVYNSAPSYSCIPYLHEALISLCDAYRPLELVLVDDGSTDCSPAYAEWARRRLLPKDVELQFLPSRINQGVGHARNRGLRAATGELLTFLDHDDVMLPNGIRSRVEFLEAHGVDAVYARRDLLVHDGFLRRVEHHVEPYHGDGFTELKTGRDQFEYLLRERRVFGHATLMCRRHVLDTIGFFREERELMGLENYGWLLKLFRRFFVRYLDESVFLLRRGHRREHLAATWEGNPDRDRIFDEVLVPMCLGELTSGAFGDDIE